MNIKGFFWVFSLELLFCEEEFKITFLDTQKKKFEEFLSV